MKGFIDPDQYDGLPDLLAAFSMSWHAIFHEGIEAVSLFVQSQEVMIQNPQDVRLFLLPIKWQGSMISETGLPGGDQINEATPTASRLAHHPLIVSAQYSLSMPGCEITPHIDNEEWIGDVLRCHLGLSCPDDCALTVDGQTKEWRDGDWLVFDSAHVEHSAYNRSGKPRLILIVDIDRKGLSK